MNSRDDLEQRLPSYFDRRAVQPPHGLLDDLLRESEAMPQRRSRFAFASFGWWAVGAAVAAMLLIAVVSLKPWLPAVQVGPGAHASPSQSTPPSVTTITVPIPVREKAIAERAATVFEDRLRALGLGNFTSAIGDEMTFSMTIPPSVNRADIDAVLHRVGEVEWLAWPDDLPPPSEGDPVPAGVLPLFDASDQIMSVSLHPGSVDTAAGEPPGVEVTFKPVASDALATYTASHLNRPMPLAMDGKILISPTIQGAISSGDLFISMVPDGPISPAALAAILESGPLPQGWTTTN
jgi:hypothetical protein